MHQIGPDTGVLPIAKWHARSGEPCVFSITKNATFSPFAEAIALAKLTDLFDAGATIQTRLEGVHLDLSNADTLFRTSPSILFGLFGIHLAYVSTTVVDYSARNVRDELIRTLWTEVGRRIEGVRGATRKVGGALVGRQKISIVCRDPDYPIPDCLREKEVTGLPTGAKFHDMYLRLVRDTSQQDSFRLPAGNRDLTTFLYEAFTNAHEHGRVRKHRTSSCLIRGILFERIGMHRFEAAHARRALEGPLRDYILRMRAAPDPSAGFLAVSIIDVGLGIHNTLPARKNETPWERVNRAFRVGESCKPIGADIQRGNGLELVLSACESLRALLLISSGSELGFFDGSNAKRGGDNALKRFSDWCECKSCGTSLTIVFPSFIERSAAASAPQAQQETLL